MHDRLAALILEFRSGARLRRRGPGTGVTGCFFGRTGFARKSGTFEVADDWFPVPNAAVTGGLNYVLDTSFRAQAQLSTWYIGLINNSGYTGVASGDTLASHAGWSEFTGYTEGTRRQWTPAAASAGSTVNAAAVQFTNGGSTANIKGMFLASDSTKSGTTGTLWATAVEDTARSLAASQVFQVYYEIDLVPQS